MITSLLAVLTWKMAIYTLVLVCVGIAWDRAGRARDAWKAKWQDANRAALEAQAQLAGLSLAMDTWKVQASAAKIRAQAAASDLLVIQDKYQALIAKFHDQPVPADAEGALAWMASVARDLAAEARR